MESNWKDSHSEETGVWMWAVDFKILDSKGKKKSENTALGHSGKGTTPRDEVPISKSSSPGHVQVPGSRELCRAQVHECCAHSHTGRCTLHTNVVHTHAVHIHAVHTHTECLPTSHQPQSTACCSLGRWSSSKPTAGGRITPGSAYLPEKNRG